MKRARGPRGSVCRGAGTARTYFEAGPGLPGSRAWNIRVAVRPFWGGSAVPGAPGAVCRKGGARRFVGPASPARGRPRLRGSSGRDAGLGRRAKGGGCGAARKYSEAGPAPPPWRGGRGRSDVSEAGPGHLVGTTSDARRVWEPRGHWDIFPGGARGLGGQACSPSGGVCGAARTYSEAGLAPPQQVGGAARTYSWVGVRRPV